jgi:hypothetical protein
MWRITMLASIAGLCAGIAGCGASNVLTATTRDARYTITEANSQISRPIARTGLAHSSGDAGERASHRRKTQAVQTAHARKTHKSQGARRGRSSAASQGARRHGVARQFRANASRLSTSPISASAGSVGPTTVQQAVATPSTNEPEEPTGQGAPPFNPCSLVTTAQAASITGASPVSSSEAPQGPTCIYTIPGASASKSEITLTVELTNFNQVVSQMGTATSSTIGGMQAYCGTLQRPMMFVRLPKGVALHITAPCNQATRFAADAVSALP